MPLTCDKLELSKSRKSRNLNVHPWMIRMISSRFFELVIRKIGHDPTTGYAGNLQPVANIFLDSVAVPKRLPRVKIRRPLWFQDGTIWNVKTVILSKNPIKLLNVSRFTWLWKSLLMNVYQTTSHVPLGFLIFNSTHFIFYQSVSMFWEI